MVTRTNTKLKSGSTFISRESNLTSKWIMVYTEIGRILFCKQINSNNGKSTLKTIHHIFEGNSKEDCIKEAKRLKLFGSVLD